MTSGSELSEIVACGLRPEGSLAHLAVLASFVFLAWRLAPPLTRRPRPGR